MSTKKPAGTTQRTRLLERNGDGRLSDAERGGERSGAGSDACAGAAHAGGVARTCAAAPRTGQKAAQMRKEKGKMQENKTRKK